MPKTMTRDEFIDYAQEALFGEGMESFYEHVTQYRSECALFGDAGPGQGLRIRNMMAEYASIARQYTRLTGIAVRPLVL